MSIIEKKIWPEPFKKILSGEKTYDIRLADEDIKLGDRLILKEWDPAAKQYTGRYIKKKVGHVGKTKGWTTYSQEDIERYGFQIISLLDNQD